MEYNTECIAYHGWGFGASCWDPWMKILPDNLNFKTFDRGYMNGKSTEPELTIKYGKRLIFTHSFGLHMVPPGQFGEADLVVIFNGFIRFHPQAARFRRRSKLILQQMAKRFQEDSREVMQEFMENVYHPHPPPSSLPDTTEEQKLLNDLRALGEVEIAVNRLKNAGKICILHGSEDKVVPKIKGRELYNKLQARSTYFEIRNAGHALPFTHTERCWSLIKPELDNLD